MSCGDLTASAAPTAPLGLLLTDHLASSPFTVVLEMDLSQKQQLLDVVIV